MNLRYKLTAGYFIFAILTVFVGYWGYQAITGIRGEFDEVSNEILPVIKVLGELRDNSLLMVASTNAYGLHALREDDDAKRKIHLDKESGLIRSAAEKIRRDYSRYESLDSKHGDEISLLQDTRKASEAFIEASERFLLSAGQRKACELEIICSRLDEAHRAFLLSIDRSIEYEERELEKSKAKVRNAIFAAFLSISAGMGGALLMAVAGGAFINAYVYRPITLLREKVEEFGRGELEARVSFSSKDEIGVLGAAFNKMAQDIQQLAYYDVLTGLPNRCLFLDRLNQALANAQRSDEMVALLFLDLDRFKDVNDTMGHPFGDQLLLSVAGRLNAHIRKSDTFARFGGDEFAIILTNIEDGHGVSVFARHVLELLTEPLTIDGKEVFISTSIGIALFPDDGVTAETLLQNVDMALYAAKASGRNAYSFFTAELNRKAHERLALETKLRHALQNGEFYLEYQPQIELKTGRLFCVEALLRWRHPEHGLIPPDRFIPVAEEMGIIASIGEWVLHTACRQNKEWQDRGHAGLRMAVNVSGCQFNQSGFVDMIDRVLAETGVNPSMLELELTESSLMTGAKETIVTLMDLKVRDIHLAIDDFGTGYSSLSYLKHFPLDRLKVDRSFIRDITTNHDVCAIVEAIIAMAHTLGLRVIAEGVEREEELEFLRERGCDEAQGYYFGRPMSPEALEDLLSTMTPSQ